MLEKSSNIPVKGGIIGGISAAIGASLCCLGPLVLLSLGVSGAWISNLVQLETYRPLFISLVVIFFAISGWQLFKPNKTCNTEQLCATASVQRQRVILFWFSLIVAKLLITSVYWLPLVL